MSKDPEPSLTPAPPGGGEGELAEMVWAGASEEVVRQAESVEKNPLARRVRGRGEGVATKHPCSQSGSGSIYQ